jgi:hypothetical protein
VICKPTVDYYAHTGIHLCLCRTGPLHRALTGTQARSHTCTGHLVRVPPMAPMACHSTSSQPQHKLKQPVTSQAASHSTSSQSQHKQPATSSQSQHKKPVTAQAPDTAAIAAPFTAAASVRANVRACVWQLCGRLCRCAREGTSGRWRQARPPGAEFL